MGCTLAARTCAYAARSAPTCSKGGAARAMGSGGTTPRTGPLSPVPGGTCT